MDHKTLPSKFYHYGIKGFALDWLHKYICNGTHFVQINIDKSSNFKIICGVPQSSILGSKRFNLCINDIRNTSNLPKFDLFPDDTSIFYSHQDIDVLLSTINNELQKLNTWFAVNKSSLNTNKAHFKLFFKRKNSLSCVAKTNNIEIDRIFYTQFLRVMTDHKLCWKEYIAFIGRKVSKTIVIIRKAKHFINSFTLLALHSSITYPYFICSIEIWGNTYRTNIFSLLAKQGRYIGKNYPQCQLP